MSSFGAIGIYFLIIFGVISLCLYASTLFPSNPLSPPTKFLPYESGIQTKTNLFEQRFHLRYTLIALLFLVFDIEIIFLYPWASIAKEYKAFAFDEMALFLISTAIGFIYVWRAGVLEWD